MIFIYLFANSAQPKPTSKNVEKKEKYEALKQEMLDQFDIKFDFFVNVDNLSQIGCKNALLLRNLCHEYLKAFFNRFPCSTQAMKKILKKERAFCIATFARVKSCYDYKQQTTRSVIDKFIGSGKRLYSKNIKREIGQKAYQKVLDEIAQAIPGNLAYLVNQPIKNDVFVKTKELCARRFFRKKLPN